MKLKKRSAIENNSVEGYTTCACPGCGCNCTGYDNLTTNSSGVRSSEWAGMYNTK